MSIYVVWIDRETAKIFNLSHEKMERSDFSSKSFENRAHEPNGMDLRARERRFFNHLAGAMPNATRVLILGPGVAKHHFQNCLNEHFPNLAKKVVGCETVDHPTDAEIAAVARKFFVGSVIRP